MYDAEKDDTEMEGSSRLWRAQSYHRDPFLTTIEKFSHALRSFMLALQPLNAAYHYVLKYMYKVCIIPLGTLQASHSSILMNDNCLT